MTTTDKQTVQQRIAAMKEAKERQEGLRRQKGMREDFERQMTRQHYYWGAF